MNRISLKSIISYKTNFPMPQELDDMTAWIEEYVSQQEDLEVMADENLPGRTERYLVKVVWQLESLVKALDSIETLASMAHLIRRLVNQLTCLCLSRSADTQPSEPLNTNRDLWREAQAELRALKGNMAPVLNGWLVDNYGEMAAQDVDDLRQAYIPETVLAYISSLHFAGSFVSRDYLMECMDLAASIAGRNGDITDEFITAGRMKELVEAFASASKALAISTSEKGGRDSITKKNREVGWSRELWTVKP